MDFGAPVAGPTIQPGQLTNTLSSIFQIRAAKAQAQQEQQTATQRTNVAKVLDNFDLHAPENTAPDGTLDMNAVLGNSDLRKAAGDSYPDIIQKLSNYKQSQLENKKSLLAINDNARKGLQEALGGLRTDPDVVADNDKGRQKVQETLGQYAAQGADQARVVGIFGPQFDKLPPGELVQHLSNIQLQAEDAGTQAAKQAPQMENVGGKIINTNPQAAGAGEGGGPTLTSSSPVTVKPPAGYGAFQDQAGNTYFYDLQNPKNVIAASDANNKSAAPPKLGVGQKENIQQSALNDEDLYNKVILPAGNKAPVIKSALLNLQKLADSGVLTGAGSENLAQVEGLMGQFGLKGAGDAAKDRQLMTKYTQQLAMQLTESNYGTDQAKSMVEHAIPNADNMTPEAMKQAAQYVYGQQEIAEARANLANQYTKKNGSSVGLRQVDSQFMQNIDPRMFDLLNMTPEQQQAYVKKNFKSPQEWKDFQGKMALINHLGGFNTNE